MGYGGALIWTAVIKNIKQQFPSKKIIFIYPLSLKAFLRGKKHADACIYMNNSHIHKKFPSFLAFFVNLLYPKRYFYLLHSEKDIPFVENDSPERIQYKAGKHMVDFIHETLVFSAKSHAPYIHLTQDEISKPKDVIEKYHLNQFICIEPNFKSSFTPNKAWEWERWQHLVDKIQKHIEENKLNIKVVQLSAPHTPKLNNIIQIQDENLSFRESAYILEKSLFFISYMGGLVHLNKAVGGKSIVLISAFEPKELGSYKNDINLYSDIECKNCGLKTPCPINRKCMQEISVEAVFNAFKKVLEEI